MRHTQYLIVLIFLFACKTEEISIPTEAEKLNSGSWNPILNLNQNFNEYNDLILTSDRKLLLNCIDYKSKEWRITNIFSGDGFKNYSLMDSTSYPSNGWLEFGKLSNGELLAASSHNDAGLFISSDNGKKWQPIADKNNNFLGDFGFNYIRTNTAQVFADNIYLKNDKGLYFSNTKGANWVKICDSLLNSCSPYIDKNIIIVRTSNDYILKSYDSGKSWKVDSILVKNEKAGLRKIIRFKENLFGISRFGLFKSDSLGRNWFKLENIPLSEVNEIYKFGNLLLITNYSGILTYISNESDRNWILLKMPFETSSSSYDILKFYEKNDSLLMLTRHMIYLKENFK